MAIDINAPSAKEVELTHKNADTDGKPTAGHHTLGPGPFQASPGNHTHDGGTSAELLELAGPEGPIGPNPIAAAEKGGKP